MSSQLDDEESSNYASPPPVLARDSTEDFESRGEDHSPFIHHHSNKPTSPCLAVAKKRKANFIELPRKVRFENYESGGEEDERNPLKVGAIVCGVPILTEREADYRLSQKVEGWKKFLFLLSNIPYVFLAVASTFIARIEHRSFHPSLDPLCESTLAHCVLACLVSITSITLHSSQVRVGHWCCSPARARTFHRRRVQDKFDLADCFCASLAVILTVLCHGITEMGMQMVAVVPIFILSIIVKKLKWWNTYLLVHGLWHLATAFLLWEIFVPPSSPLRVF